MSSTNHSPSLESIIAESSTRRGFVQAGLGALAVNFFDSPALASAQHAPLPFSFTSVPVSSADKVMVPDGYQATPLYRWGDPANGSEPAFRPDASNSAADQRRQAGMGHDGMQWFSRPGDKANESQRGLLVINHEYTDQGLLFPDGIARMSAEKIEKSKNAHGISVIAVEQHDRHWHVVTSKWTRRITADTEMIITGPAAGSTHTITKADPEGKKVLGTFNNCASGKTPWGTYLTCEENFHGYFGSENTSHQADQNQRRYGLKASGKTSGDSGLSLYHWWADDDRFDLDKHPNEANRFGYVVEIDPSDPKSTPRKHSALGRFKHENAELTLAADGRVVVYMGDDEKNEYIYKFISKDRYDGKPENRAAHLRLLEKGTLYVAKFHSGGGGEWVALQHGKNGLTPKHGFANQGDICVRTRQAADLVRATSMDRPEWVAVHPGSGEVFVTLTNNSQRGKLPSEGNRPDGSTAASKATPAVDDANPRSNNVFGHILKWQETGYNAAALTFEWDHFLLAGDPEIDTGVSIRGDSFGSPDGLHFDPRGILWIQTDVSSSKVSKGPYKNLGNNMMLAADPKTRTVRRFLTGPNGCEVTGITMSPDLKTMFVNIQHPGEPASGISDPKSPKMISDWPDGPTGSRPRPATIAIQKNDGGLIGT